LILKFELQTYLNKEILCLSIISFNPKVLSILVFQTRDFGLIYGLGHLLKFSYWPIAGGLYALCLFSSFLGFFKWGSWVYMRFPLFFLVIARISWWMDVSKEGRRGDYTPLIVDGLKGGIILFIFREICFFASFFWTFFHNSFNPDIQIGLLWPPVALKVFRPFQIPLLNTLILLGRGATVTWSHHHLIGGEEFKFPLLFTIFLGVYFTFLQGFEYLTAFFTIRDRIYGSVFFIATGFHGLHVLVGSIFLITCFFRSNTFHVLSLLGYEIAIWYWHFVDVVWIFLFSFIYWWGCSELIFDLKSNKGVSNSEGLKYI